MFHKCERCNLKVTEVEYEKTPKGTAIFNSLIDNPEF